MFLQENGCNRHGDDLFDILIQRGGNFVALLIYLSFLFPFWSHG